MKRCIQTAGLVYDCANPFVIEEWQEIDFGRFEGKNYRELSGNAEYQAWLDSNGELPFPGGESRENFIARNRRGLEKAAKELAKRAAAPNAVAAVVHGGSMMALLSTFCGGNYFDYQCKNGEGVLCRLTLTDVPALELLRKL